MRFVLKKTKDPYKIFNKEGYNPLHLAVQTNCMVACFSEHFDVNIHMNNGETALHIAAQLGDSSSLEALIERGGDLSVRDIEDGHTPLHDCLQQVYFEGGVTEEKCDKFIRIWNTVVEKAVQWWCLKQGVKCKPPAHGSEEYSKLQCKAVYYLRSLIKNNDGLSVLQFAADRGLITCVQTMLSTKAVFVLQTKAPIENPVIQSLEEGTVHEIDVTNLCPEYFVKKTLLYSESELDMFKVTDDEGENKNKHQNKGDNEMTSFLDVLAKIQPPNKAGEILESIPMMRLTRLEWKRTRMINVLWMIVHISLMVLTSFQITTYNDPLWSAVLTLMYGTIITGSHLVLIIMRLLKRGQTTLSVEESIKKYEKDDGEKMDKYLSIPLKISGKTIIVCELFFTVFALFIISKINLDTEDLEMMKGFFLLFGWLMLLFPLRSFSPIYKLISVLKYIVIRDMFPWITIYITISLGFALAIRLQFGQLPSSSSCEDLTAFLDKTGRTFFELVVMTSGLETDLRNARSLACLFGNNSKRVYMILFLITLYAVISAVILLNMLIAIMSNTVTNAQRDKGWRQYQVS